ncbi:MAG: helix-turn-helix transcriptional regulator [Bacteroidia bacterium]|nr:helix-turn-helix transcriptional regulator [Bacteroidia bacterium]
MKSPPRKLCPKKKNSNRIKEILEREDTTRTELAERIGKSRGVVSNYVNNNPQLSLETLFLIARVLQVNARELINS